MSHPNQSQHSATVPGRAWQRRKEHREPEILTAARHLFEQNGYEKTSMADIARAAGVSEATVYKYFEHKRALMTKVLHEWMEPAIRSLQQAVDAATGTQARLRALCQQHFRAMVVTQAMHRIAYRELRWDAYYGSSFHRLNQRYTRICLDVLAQGQRDGEIQPGIDAAGTRDLIYGTLEHVGWRTILVGRAVNVDATAIAIADQIFTGIAARPAPADDTSLAALVTRLEAAIATLERTGASRPQKRSA
jgi:TetR/AcrR family fatty acid metabolism transcriptional regulator